MNYLEIKKLVRSGKIGLIPKWVGYLKWDYNLNELYFVNGNYKMSQEELEKKIINKNDLYYII